MRTSIKNKPFKEIIIFEKKGETSSDKSHIYTGKLWQKIHPEQLTPLLQQKSQDLHIFKERKWENRCLLNIEVYCDLLKEGKTEEAEKFRQKKWLPHIKDSNYDVILSHVITHWKILPQEEPHARILLEEYISKLSKEDCNLLDGGIKTLYDSIMKDSFVAGAIYDLLCETIDFLKKPPKETLMNRLLAKKEIIKNQLQKSNNDILQAKEEEKETKDAIKASIRTVKELNFEPPPTPKFKRSTGKKQIIETKEIPELICEFLPPRKKSPSPIRIPQPILWYPGEEHVIKLENNTP